MSHFVIKCYNDLTGKVQTVSDPIKDITSEETGDNLNRSATVTQFAKADSNTYHVYYADTVNVPATD